MKRLAFALISAGLFALAGCSSSPSAGAQPAQATPNATQVAVKAGGKTVAEGRVVPARSATLSFTAGGVVSEVLVIEGAQVKADQVIVRLDARTQIAAVAQADAAFKRAQSQLDALKAGPRPQEVASAKAALDGAQAQLAKLLAGVPPEDVSASAAAVAIAQVQLQQVQEGNSPQQIESARADLANAAAVLKLRQADYDRVAYEPGVGARPESIALEQATNTFAAARARYDDLAKGPTASSLALAKARVQQAVAQLNAVKVPARPADIDAVKADIRKAQAQLDLVQAGARPEDIAAAQASVDSAKAAQDQAMTALSQTELRAPFAGVVAFLDARVGEQLAPNAVAVRMADPSVWEVETTDLTELNIVSVHEGSKAIVTVDALPGVDIAGKVIRIRQYGENKQGDIVYQVVVRPDSQDQRLRWNMTASVTLEP